MLIDFPDRALAERLFFEREYLDIIPLLTAEERAWIDFYHSDVARIVGPQLEGAEKAWPMEATRPLD